MGYKVYITTEPVLSEGGHNMIAEIIGEYFFNDRTDAQQKYDELVTIFGEHRVGFCSL